MDKVERQVLIEAPVDKVWSVLADFGNVAPWAPTIPASRLLTEATGGVGAERTCTHEAGFEVTERVVEWNEGRDFSYDVYGLPTPIESLRVTWAIRAQDNATMVTLTLRPEIGSGPPGLTTEALEVGVRENFNTEMGLNLAGLRYHIETGRIVHH
ncbi:MAG: SRPBCC family protein [Actinobacteria bacterium]|nr:SRPBCC family protein [Actinomycetota bacterium]